jgi:hypothetical protein
VRLLDWLLQYPRAAVIALGAAITAALATYSREQSLMGVQWALRPITALLPWNRIRLPAEPRTLASTLTIVDLRLLRADGSFARYRKISAYRANAQVTYYREGVTASGIATAFRTSRGRILETAREHGFYMSTIELGRRLNAGEEFVNVYEAELRDSFCQSSEEWTQQLSFETAQLVIQVHFPADRGPISFRTQLIDGTDERSNTSSAEVVELYGRKSLVWNVAKPSSGYIYKLTWLW